jgi:Leucine-rich repeat (LRR) protein
MVEIEDKVGSPWSVLPIKNKKYAKDLLEVHLSDRTLTKLENFEEFPNLEVIWLNNNLVSTLTHTFFMVVVFIELYLLQKTSSFVTGQIMF